MDKKSYDVKLRHLAQAGIEPTSLAHEADDLTFSRPCFKPQGPMILNFVIPTARSRTITLLRLNPNFRADPHFFAPKPNNQQITGNVMLGAR